MLLKISGYAMASSLFALMGCSAFTPSTAPPECLANTDCSNGRICVQEVCVVACRIDSECADDERCVFSQCEPLPAVAVDGSMLSDADTADMSSDAGPAPDGGSDGGFDMQVGDGAVADMAVGDMTAGDMAAPDMAEGDMAASDMAGDMPTADMAADMAAPDMGAAADMAEADAE